MDEDGNIIFAMPNEEGAPQAYFNWASLWGIGIGLLLGWWFSRTTV